MAKVTGLGGKAVGKCGSIVYSVTAGQTIAREYNPNVANPSTSAQVDQRAKMKLMSQISAAFAPVIVIPKEGLKSSRNLFVKKNFDQVMAEGGVAQVTYENLQLTAGNAGLPAIVLSRSAASGISASLEERCDAAVSRVVYILYRKTSESTLQYVESIVVESAGAEGMFPGTLVYMEGDIVVFAYGIKDLSAKATAKYADYEVSNGEDIAKLTMARAISTSDYQFTRTRGTTLFAGESESVQVGDNQARVYVTAVGNGSVSGAGVFNLGSQVTVVATAADGSEFVGWRKNGTTAYLSTNPSYTFTLEGTADLVAVFRVQGVASDYIINVQTSDGVENAEATNDGVITAGESCTLQATLVDSSYIFSGWFDVTNGANTRLSGANPYTFTPTKNMTIEARASRMDG